MNKMAKRLGAAMLCALGLAATQASADLRVNVENRSIISVDSASGQFYTDVNLIGAGDWLLNCSGLAGGDAPRTGIANLTGGAWRCAGQRSDAWRFSALVGSAVNANGKVAATHASQAIAPRGTVTGEAIVLVAGGANHNDADIDGMLDAGETIDYHYTVLNLGGRPLSNLALNDLAGAVACPQTSLAVGASMICTRQYAITAANVADTRVVNVVSVDAEDPDARALGAVDVLLTQNLAGHAGIRVFKSPSLIDDADANSMVSVGDRLRYTFVIKNSGAEALSSVNLFEPDPTRIDTPLVCDSLTLGGVAFGANGSGVLASNDLLQCTAEYTVRASDAAISQVLNLSEVRAQAPVAGLLIATGASTVVVPVPPMIGVSKVLESSVGIGPGPYAVHYRMVVWNYGITALENVQVTENLRQTFPLPVGFNVVSVTADGTGAANPGFDGELDTDLLNAAASTLAPGDFFTIDLRITVSPGDRPGPYLNQVIASGNDSLGQTVADVSVSGVDPDPDGDGIPDEQSPTPIIFNILPPPLWVPVSSPFALLALLLLVGVIAVRTRPRG
ncbi:MAG: hypothetical protein WC995_08840 [Lysobacteraceae bacterium]